MPSEHGGLVLVTGEKTNQFSLELLQEEKQFII